MMVFPYSVLRRQPFSVELSDLLLHAKADQSEGATYISAFLMKSGSSEVMQSCHLSQFKVSVIGYFVDFCIFLKRCFPSKLETAIAAVLINYFFLF